VSATLAGKVRDFRGRPIGDLMLRGRSEAMRALEPLRVDQYEKAETKDYIDAFVRPAIPARSRLLRPISANTRRISLQASTSSDC